MGNTHFSGPLFVAGVQITDASGNLIAPVEVGDLEEIVDANGNEILEFDSNASAVNHIVIENSATTVRPKIKTGGEADIGIDFENDQSEPIVRMIPVASSLNWLDITNSATGNPVLLANNGEDDVGFEFHAKNGEEMLKLEATAAATTFVSVKSQSTGNNPEISAEGEADLGLTFMNDQGEELAILSCTATAVNEFTLANADTGNPPTMSATGDDTNINMKLAPKGTGYVDVAGGLQHETVTLTANTDSGAGSSIEDGARQVAVTGVTTDANDWIVLPAIANVPIGHSITVACNASSNFEVRTPAASNTTINNVDSDGTQEYLATDTDVIVFTKHTATGWIGVSYTNLGAVRTAVVPD